MTPRLSELYPEPGRTRDLEGTWLAEAVHSCGRVGAPIIYGSFVSSLDGRIAVTDPASGALKPPEAILTSHDFRLLRELMAQADCFVTHGGYLRAIETGTLDDILHIGLGSEAEYLARWRSENGFSGQPGVVVVSASLDFTVPRSLRDHGQRVAIVTVDTAPIGRIRRLEQEGFEVIVTSDSGRVQGDAIADAVTRLGYRSAYLVAGPQILHTLLEHRRLGRLFVTITHQILGGESFATLASGPPLGNAGYLELRSLYYDRTLPAGAGQWFAQFAPSAELSCSDRGC